MPSPFAYQQYVPPGAGVTTVRRMAFVPFSAEQMFDLVNDVAAYPAFLPWCAGSEILSQDAGAMRARLRLAASPELNAAPCPSQ